MPFANALSPTRRCCLVQHMDVNAVELLYYRVERSLFCILRADALVCTVDSTLPKLPQYCVTVGTQACALEQQPLSALVYRCIGHHRLGSSCQGCWLCHPSWRLPTQSWHGTQGCYVKECFYLPEPSIGNWETGLQRHQGAMYKSAQALTSWHELLVQTLGLLKLLLFTTEAVLCCLSVSGVCALYL